MPKPSTQTDKSDTRAKNLISVDMNKSISEAEASKTIPNFSHIRKNNPSGYILRTNLTEKTGGLLRGRTEANRDSLGIGIPGRITIGKRKVAYPVEEVVRYLQSKITVHSEST